MFKSRPTPALPAPAFLDKWPVLLGTLLFLLIPFFLPIPMELRRHPLIGHLGDQVHVPFLMTLTLLLYWRGPLKGRLILAILGGMALGGSIEFVQVLVGRSAHWSDFYLDLAGIGMATGLVMWRGHRLRLGLALMVSLVLILSAQLYFLPGLILGSYHAKQSFPVISDFEGPYNQWLWSESYESRIDFVKNGNGTILRLESGPPSRWPGAEMCHFPNDWTEYNTLKLDVRHTTPGREKVPFSVRLDDYRTRLDKNWVTKSFQATTEWTTYSLPFFERPTNLGDRILNLRDMSFMIIFLSDKNDSTIIEIDNLRLE